MKKILYVGNKDTFQMFKKVTPKNEAYIRLLTGDKLGSEKIISVIKDEKNLWGVIINLAEISIAISNIEDIVEEVLSELENTKLCIMAQGYSLYNNKIQMLLELGLQYLMPYIDNDSNIRVYKQILDKRNHSNIDDVFSNKRLPSKSQNSQELESSENRQNKQKKEAHP